MIMMMVRIKNSISEFRYELYKNCDTLLENLRDFIILYSPNRFIIKEIKYLVKCLLSIAGLDKEYFDNEIMRCDRKLKQPLMMIEGEEKILKDKKALYEIIRDKILAIS